MKHKKINTQNNYGALVQGRLHHVLSKEIEALKNEGLDVPSVSLSVKADTRIEFKPEKQFTKLYESCMRKIEEEYGLSITEKGIIFTLLYYINYEDNLLCFPDGTALRKKDLGEILGLAHNAVDKYIDALVEKGILGKTKVSRCVKYHLNPYIAYRGTRIDNTLLSMFNNTK